jgi:hypothetical protein
VSSFHNIDITPSIASMLTTHSSNKNSNAGVHGGSKGCAGVPPSVTKSRATHNNLLLSDITSGIVNVELQEPKILPNMGQASFEVQYQDGKKAHWNGKGKKNFDNSNSRSIGVGNGSHYKEKRSNKGKKKIFPIERLHQGWKQENQQQRRFEKGDASSPKKEIGRRIDDVIRPGTGSYEWLDRINKNQHGIQGVVFLNEFGQPVVEYLPQEGFEYRIVLKTTNNDQNVSKHLLSKDTQNHPFDQNHQLMSQGIFANHVITGCPILEGTVVPSAGTEGFMYASQGYASYMYGLPPQHQGHPMMMMMMQHPSNPPQYRAQDDVVYVGYHHYPNEQHFYQPPHAGFTNEHNVREENYEQAHRLPPLPLDDYGRTEEIDDASRVSLEPRLARHGKCSSVPNDSPIP